MPEPDLRQGALAHLGLKARAVADPGAAAVHLSERPHRIAVELRGSPRRPFLEAVKGATGLDLPRRSPLTANAGRRTALWLGPDRWLVVAPDDDRALADALRRALAEIHSAVTDISDSFAIIGLAGPRAREVLMKGCSLDLHPRVFKPGEVAQSTLAKADIILHQTKESTFDIYVRRSFADYLWRWLEDAGAEYGVAVLAA